MSADKQINIIENSDAAPIIDLLNAQLERSDLDPYEVKLQEFPLSFYKEWSLIAIEASEINALYDASLKQIIVLDGVAETIEKANSAKGFSLNQNNVAEYIQFYFKFTRGRHGVFQVIENTDAIDWQAPPPIATKKSLDEMIAPIIVSNNDSAGFDIEACVLFKDSLFNTAIEVSMEGRVSIKGQEVLIKGLDVPDATLS